jgi:hypothetical protein
MKRSTFPLNVLRGILLLSLTPTFLLGQNSSYRPGTIDPSGNPRNLTLFRDEQIYSMGLPSAAGNPWRSATVRFDGSLTPASTVSPLSWSSDISFREINAQAAVGHIVHPDRDDVLIVQRSGANQSTLVGRFTDNSGSVNIAPILDRVTGYTDFVSVSAGDLDKLYDADGNYHDEVVVAWMQAESTGGALVAAPHLGVLNYNGKDPSNPTLTQVRIDAPSFTTNDLTVADQYIDGYQYAVVPAVVPLAVDSIISTAVGDFDGDGTNEVALAYMKRGGGTYPKITVVIYRYLNDGTTASLTPVNSYDLSMPFPNGSMAGTVSLAAGNFDGSGSDQLLVSAVEWSGTAQGAFFLKDSSLANTPVAFLLIAGPTQGTITGAASSSQDNSTTDFTVSLSPGVYVPRVVTIAGASGNWAQINGTWPVTPTAAGFTLGVDSSGFGSFVGQNNITVTVAAQLKQSDYTKLEPYSGITGGAIQVGPSDRDGRIRVQALAGLFHFDPQNGFDYRRRQVAVAWNARPTPALFPDLARRADTHVALLQITNDDKIQIANYTNGLFGDFQTFQSLSMAAGALRGDNDTNDPTWSLYFTGVGIDFIGSNVARGMMAAVWKVSPLDGDLSKLNPEFVCSDKANTNESTPDFAGAPTPVCPIWVDSETAISPSDVGPMGNLNYLRLPSVAADLKGNSLQLGAPVHFEITDPGKADFVLEQPPQHAAYLDLGSGPAVVTINRYPTFNTAMRDSQSKAFASKTTNHSDWNIGASEQVSASNTVTEGDIEGTGAQTKYSLSEKVGYDYNKVHSDYASHADSYVVGSGTATGEDDSLIVEARILDIWRYRIFGAQTGDPQNPNAFYEIVMPGPSLTSKPGGRDVDWYQPVHEVGNVLSYPGRTDVCSPSDLGPITIPNTDISNQAIPLIPCSQQFYNGNSSSISLALQDQTGGGGSDDYTHKVQADLDFQFAFKASAGVKGIGSVAAQVQTDIDVHGGSSWGQLTTNDNSTTGATGITINSPQGDSQFAYPYYPILYNTTAGGLKVSYGVGDLTASSAGSAFWGNNYAQHPDPALNLPNRFVATYSTGNVLNGWKQETTIVRKRMKGFVIRKTDIDPVTGNYPLLGSNPQDGDKVLLEARVYNYSISSMPASFTVQFSAIPYDSLTNNETCPNIPTTGSGGRVCPASARTIIGYGNTKPDGQGKITFILNARENMRAYLVWNTQGFGPQSPGFNEYRVYVDLISNTDELYPPEPACTAIPCEDNFSNENNVDPGQNNEGWSLISVAKRLSGGALGGPSSSEPNHGTLGVGTANASPIQLAANIEGNDACCRRPKPLVAYLFQPLPLQLTAFSDAVSHLHGYVSVFDGKPGAPKSTTIAIKTLHGVTPQGTSAWFDWTPKKKGPHHLYAVIQNTAGIKPLGDVVIHVRRAPGDLNEDGRVDRHDLIMLERDLHKTVAESACGEECDLDGDGKITQKDVELMAGLCNARDCAFARMEYVGGASPSEPDMRATRSADDASTAAFLAANPGDKEATSSADHIPTTQLYVAELQRKQSLRSIQYYYHGKPVTQGPFAQGNAVVAKR